MTRRGHRIENPGAQGETMKYMITWNERPQGSPIEYENAQKRILEVFSPWKAPANFKIEAFVIRVGDWGGYMLMECDDPLEVHKFCSMLPAFTFEARPVVPVADAIRVELEAMAYRDGLKKEADASVGAEPRLVRRHCEADFTVAKESFFVRGPVNKSGQAFR